jgi:hypothetical protein
MTAHPLADRFTYDGYTIDPSRGEVECRYRTGEHSFTERYCFGSAGQWDHPAVAAAVRILFLLAGVSYYKTTAAPVIELGSTATTSAERDFLASYYRHGLGEFAYRNDLDLNALQIVGPDLVQRPPVSYTPPSLRPLIPFGGGIDSIVTVAQVTAGAAGARAATLFVVNPPGDRFAAIEDAAAVTGLPVVHVTREIDPLVRRSAELGFLNGHVPITAVIMATALVAAVLDGRDAVVLSNEWSASVPTMVHDGQAVNHQWSKSAEFETLFSDLAAATLGPAVSVFSYLRHRSELWVARQFAELTQFHDTFRSCNRSFHQDPAQRLDHWCGVCDKCCFIDLILSPYMTADDLGRVFSGHEPLRNDALVAQLEALLGLEPDAKPFECVGDVDECRVAVLLAAGRADRADDVLVQSLATHVTTLGASVSAEATLLAPLGGHFIPDRYVPADLLV